MHQWLDFVKTETDHFYLKDGEFPDKLKGYLFSHDGLSWMDIQ